MNKITIHSDGGARGNPGPAAVGVVIEGPAGKKTYHEYIGKTTNNEAEYRALILALKKVKQLYGSEKLAGVNIECYADSELMVNQLNGKYKIKEAGIQGFFIEIWNLKIELDAVLSFHHIERAKNAQADELVNQALDKEASKLDL